MNDESKVCPHTYNCKLFPILKASSALDYWTQAYCNSDFDRCARYTSLVAGQVVPPNLLPNGKKI